MSSSPNLNNGKYRPTLNPECSSDQAVQKIIRLHVFEVLNIRNRILYY